MKDNMTGFYLWAGGTRPAALTRAECARLMREYKMYGDPKIREKLIYGSLGLVQRLVNKYYKKFIAFDDQINPSREDLYEIGVEVLIKSIDKFDPDEYNFLFSTYFSHQFQGEITHLFDERHRRSVISQKSLNQPETNPKTGEVSKHDIIENLPSKYEDFKILHDKMELEYIKKEVLPLLPKRDRDIFIASVLKHKSQTEIAQLFCVSQAAASRLISEVQEKVKRMYLEGPTSLDRQQKGVKLKGDTLAVLKKNNEIIEKYGREFLRQNFLPTLSASSQQVFEATVLNYRGQAIKEIAQSLGKSISYVSHERSIVLTRLELVADKLKEQQKPQKQWKPILKTSQEINLNEKLIEQYGGKFFLQKYFVPILSPVQRKVFECGVLEFAGQTKTELAKKAGVSVFNFSTLLKGIKEKLAATNFEVLVDLMDNKYYLESIKGSLPSENKMDISQVEKRRLVVKKFGGKEKLVKYFLPVLPETQKQVFDLLYIRQTFATLSGLAEYLHMPVANVLTKEKLALEKLESTSLEELEKLDKMAEKYLQEQKAQKLSNANSTRKDIIANYGGIAFLREKFVPQIITKADREIFEGVILEGQPARNFVYLFSKERKNKKHAYTSEVAYTTLIVRVSHRIKTEILPQLEKFKADFPDFEKAVKDFYVKRGFEQLHPEDFEQVAFGQEITESKQSKKKGFISPELVEKAGGEAVVLRKFRSTLSLSYQIIFMKSYIEKMTDSQIAKDLQMTTAGVGNARASIVQKLEDFAQKQESPKNIKPKTK